MAGVARGKVKLTVEVRPETAEAIRRAALSRNFGESKGAVVDALVGAVLLADPDAAWAAGDAALRLAMAALTDPEADRDGGAAYVDDLKTLHDLFVQGAEKEGPLFTDPAKVTDPIVLGPPARTMREAEARAKKEPAPPAPDPRQPTLF